MLFVLLLGSFGSLFRLLLKRAVSGSTEVPRFWIAIR